MTRTKPNCPTCSHSQAVRTIGGGSTNKYRYECDICSTKWQQTPPHRSEDAVDTDDLVICKSNDRRSNAYKCGRCGQPKKGHVCSVSNPDKAQLEAAKTLASNTFLPPTSAFLLEQPVLLDGEQITIPSLPKMPFSGFMDSF